METQLMSIVDETLKLFVDDLHFSALTPAGIIASMLSALVCGVIIYLVYHFCYRGVVYSDNFNVLLVMITAITGFIIMTISSNVVLSPAARLNSVLETVNCVASDEAMVPVSVPVPLLLMV